MLLNNVISNLITSIFVFGTAFFVNFDNSIIHFFPCLHLYSKPPHPLCRYILTSSMFSFLLHASHLQVFLALLLFTAKRAANTSSPFANK